jgi:hypothetical protein
VYVQLQRVGVGISQYTAAPIAVFPVCCGGGECRSSAAAPGQKFSSDGGGSAQIVGSLLVSNPFLKATVLLIIFHESAHRRRARQISSSNTGRAARKLPAFLSRQSVRCVSSVTGICEGDDFFTVCHKVSIRIPSNYGFINSVQKLLFKFVIFLHLVQEMHFVLTLILGVANLQAKSMVGTA